ncbi:GH13690 [Drosophila grimshawi]|uniref:GH13690 n=1 Tax=Drosophila grimshawi TaxID=7222 RepID=B4JQF7_DROGR|nr:GH13690 [Drosophila grimshawi]
MDFANEMHDHYLKDFIHSLQLGSEDSSDHMHSQNRSQSESSLNPNAAEFVPSFMKISDGAYDNVNDDDDNQLISSTTTLVNKVINGDGLHVNRDDSQSRIQRQLFYLMKQLGTSNLPLSDIQLSLTPNGQGINVQFMPKEYGQRNPLDEQLCMAAGFRLEIGDSVLQSKRPCKAVAAQFLSRMSELLEEKSEEQTLCPQCTGMPKKCIYTELEIERQIEDIKGFEKLITEDAGTRYQEAFKELCQKLGLTTSGEQSMESTAAPAARQNDELNAVEEPYEWDSFTANYDSTYNCAAPSGFKLPVNKLLDVQQQQRKQDQKKQSSSKLNVPTKIQTNMSSSSSTYPKLYKINQGKWTGSQGTRVAKASKESKIQRSRFSSLGFMAAAASAAAGTATGTGIATGTIGSSKKLPERPQHVKEDGSIRSYQRESPQKSGIVSNILDMRATQIGKPTRICKMEPPRSQQQLDRAQVQNVKTAPTTSRASTMAQGQSTKISSAGAQRVLAPRSTHASQMRQSEVKRRLNLMRGDNETDVQFNEYLFK